MVCFATEDFQSTKYLVQDKDLKLVHHRRKMLSKHTRNIEKAESNMAKHESLLKFNSPVTIMELEQQKQSRLINPDFVYPTLNMLLTKKETNSNYVTLNNIKLMTKPDQTTRFNPYRTGVQKIKPSFNIDNPTNLISKVSPLRIELNEHEKLHRENKRKEMMQVLNLMKTRGAISSDMDKTELPLNLSIRSVETNMEASQRNYVKHTNKLFCKSEQESIPKQERLEKYYLEKEEQLFTKYINPKINKTSHKDLLLQTKATQECLDYSRSSVIASGLLKLETNSKVECR